MIIIIILRYKQESTCETKYINIMIGEILTTKDMHKILLFLLYALKSDLFKIGFDNNGNLRILVIENCKSRNRFLAFENEYNKKDINKKYY